MSTTDERCINYKALAQKLGRSESTMQKEWRMYPHYFVGRGYNLKSARFDFTDVLEDMKEKARGIQTIQRTGREIPDHVQAQRKAIQPGCKNQGQGSGVENSKAQSHQKGRETNPIRFDVFRHVNDLSGRLPSKDAAANG